jgi:hypothetical protein
VAVCSEKLEEAYELAQTSFMHEVEFIKDKHADSAPNLFVGDWFKRLGCNSDVRSVDCTVQCCIACTCAAQL